MSPRRTISCTARHGGNSVPSLRIMRVGDFSGAMRRDTAVIGVVRVCRVVRRIGETGRIISPLMGRAKSSWKTTRVVREFTYVSNVG